MRRRPSWTAVLAWALWLVTLLALPATAWLDTCCGRPARPS
jgi:hypothetical protein